MASMSVSQRSRSASARRDASRPRWTQRASATPRPSNEGGRRRLEMVEDGERLERDGAAAVGRMAERRQAAVGGRDGRAPVRTMRDEVGVTDGRTGRLRGTRPHDARQVAGVQHLGALSGEVPKRARKRGERDAFAEAPRSSVRSIRPSPVAVRAEGRRRPARRRPTIRRSPGTRRRARWQAPAGPPRPGGRSGRAPRATNRRRRARSPSTGRARACCVRPAAAAAVASGAGGRAAAAIERHDTVRDRVMDEPERVAAQTTGVARDDGERGVDRDGRVHRRATRPQTLDARLRGEVVRARDRAVAPRATGTGIWAGMRSDMATG